MFWCIFMGFEGLYAGGGGDVFRGFGFCLGFRFIEGIFGFFGIFGLVYSIFGGF